MWQRDLLVGEPVEVDERLADGGEEAGDGGVDGVDEDEGEDALADAELSDDVNLKEQRFFQTFRGTTN